jgi:hypothetical protein
VVPAGELARRGPRAAGAAGALTSVTSPRA